MKKTIELGTSLLEVISVLCIMGILSYSAFALYAKAMNTIRSNYVIQQVFLKANELNTSAVGSRHKTIDLKVIEKDELSYGFSFKNYEKDGDKFMISIEGSFSAGVCEILKEKISSQEYQGLKDILAVGKIKNKEGQEENLSRKLSKEGCPKKTEDITEISITSMQFIIDAGFQRQKF